MLVNTHRGIHIQSDQVVGVPRRFMGRKWIAWYTRSDGSRHYGPLRYTRYGAETALLNKMTHLVNPWSPM